MRVVVVGAGLGGLSAALHAAGGGHQVTVLESAPVPGGKAGWVELGGVAVDTGPSVLTLPETFDEAFRAVGERLVDRVRLRSEGGRFRYRFADGTSLDVHHETERTMAEVEATYGVEAKRDLTAFLAYARRIWETSAPHFVFADAPSASSIMKLGIGQISAVRHLDAWRTMWAAIEDQVRDPHLRNILARYATYNGSNVLTAPATLNCIAHVELSMGGWGVEGGIAALVSSMAAAAKDAGVEIRFDAPVRSIDVRKKAAAGVTLESGESIPADAVVANCEAAQLPRLLGRPPRGKGEPPSTSGWNAIVRARRRPDRPAHEVVFPADYREEFRDLHERNRPPADPTAYVCAKQAAHGGEAWPEHEPLFLMANAPAVDPDGRSRTDWSALERAVWERLVRAEIVDPTTDEIVWRRTPEDLARRFPGSRGALYGASSNSMWAAFRRPSNRVEGVRGLYLASGSAHPGGGMPLVVLSGRIAVQNLEFDTHSRRRKVGSG